MTTAVKNTIWNLPLIERYNQKGPRYTSYPTALEFNHEFKEGDWLAAVERSNLNNNPLSLYFHIPFCDTICYYCACNKIVTADKSKAVTYIEYIEKELELQARHLDKDRPVTQLHWGGGTPTYLNDSQKHQLMAATRQHFNLADDGEFSIEIHPQGANAQTIIVLRELGFNRLSMGVQDFDPQVQRAVNRFNDVVQVQDLVTAARNNNFHSISLDLIYGLPYQNCSTLHTTIEKVISLSPDRLSLFNYAHLPHIFKTQRQIDESTLPSPDEKLAMLELAIQLLSEAGYYYIGMDHFAKPDDELAIAQQARKLHRNFQGYATHGNCDMIAFGVSSIAMIGDCYIQNHKKLDDYYQDLDQGKLPISKGAILSKDDLIRRDIINQLICNFEVIFSEFEQKWSINFCDYFADSLAKLAPLTEDDLLKLSQDKITINDYGRLLVRRICMAFDAYLPDLDNSENKSSSRII